MAEVRLARSAIELNRSSWSATGGSVATSIAPGPRWAEVLAPGSPLRSRPYRTQRDVPGPDEWPGHGAPVCPRGVVPGPWWGRGGSRPGSGTPGLTAVGPPGPPADHPATKQAAPRRSMRQHGAAARVSLGWAGRGVLALGGCSIVRGGARRSLRAEWAGCAPRRPGPGCIENFYM